MVATQIIFQKYLEMSLDDEVLALEFARAGQLTDRSVYVVGNGNGQGDPLDGRQEKFGVSLGGLFDWIFAVGIERETLLRQNAPAIVLFGDQQTYLG